MNPDLHTDDYPQSGYDSCEFPTLTSDEIRMLRNLLKGYINGYDSKGISIRKAKDLEQKLWAMQ
jgi:hypothetical protein